MRTPKEKPEAFLLGIATDNADGHKRITRAEQFSIIGGSEETHEKMTKTMIQTFKDIQNSGRLLNELEPQELFYLLDKNHSDSA